MSNMMKLSMARTLSPYSALDPISGASHTQSASLAQAERDIKELQDENLRLKTEISEIGSAYKQLITENTHENFEERRVTFLKAQMIQLERQLLVLSDALSSRSATLLDVENSLAAVADCCRKYTTKDGRIGEVHVTRDDLKRMEETAESARIKLYKNIENTSAESLQRPVAMYDRFLRCNTSNPPTLLDVCSGKMDHLNLKHVAKLESQLAILYRQLMLVNKSLHSIVPVSQAQKPANENAEDFKRANRSDRKISANREVPKAVYVRLATHVTKACDMLKDASEQLLVLSVLVPSAPWPPLKKPLLKELTTDNVMSKVTGVARSKIAEVKHIIDSLIKAMNYKCHMTNAETRALKDELELHQDIYQLQMEYMDGLFTALGKGYSNFQSSANDSICQPLKEILRVYETLKLTASEDALKHFLQVFKLRADQISDAVNNMSNHHHKEEGQEAIVTYRDEFFDTVYKLRTERQHHRDELLGELDRVKQQYEQHREEVSKLFPETNDTEKVVKTNVSDIAVEPREMTNHEGGKKEKIYNKSRTDVSSVQKKVSLDHTNDEMEEANGPPCNCGADVPHMTGLGGDTHRSKIDRTSCDEPAGQSEYLTYRKSHHGTDSAHEVHRPSHSKKSPQNESSNTSRRPPKPVKGVAQSHLVLHPTTDQQTSKAGEETKESHTLFRRADSWVDVSDARESPSFTAEEMAPTDRSGRLPRSGSLSRLGQKSPMPAYLEPLVGPVLHKRSNESSGKPWK